MNDAATAPVRGDGTGSADRAGRLGATVVGDATRFEVWAPSAQRVEVVVEHDQRTSSHDMANVSDVEGRSGSTWIVTVDGVGDGDRYRIRLDGVDWFPDPASRRQPDGVHGASAVVDVDGFAWTDTGWTGIALADAVLYELHVGTFTPGGTFDAAIGQLDRLRDLGITMIEIMPVNAFPGERNWGYDGVLPFAVQESYGGPAGLARFVDAAHDRGLGVVLDVVYNHFGPEGNVLTNFGPYLTDMYSTPWGGAVNVSGPMSDAVRRFFIENAVGWIDDFHLDGLRLDAVHAIVDPTPVPFVEELTSAVHETAREAGRTVLVTIESSSNDPRIVRSQGVGGWGADAVWNDDFHHTLRVALTGERHEYYAGYDGVADLATALEHRWVYRGQYSPVFDRRHGASADDVDPAHFIVFAQNHDHVGNTPRGLRLLHDAGPDDPRLKLAASTILLSPFTPMLFMGEEYGERAPFPYFIDHGDADLVEAVRQGRQAEFAGVDWAGGVADPADPATFAAATLDPSLAGSGAHRGLSAMYTELLRVRRAHRILTDPDGAHDVTTEGRVIIVERSDATATSTLVLNFADQPYETPSAAGDVVFDSAAAQWSGSDTAGAGDADRRRVAPTSARLTISTQMKRERAVTTTWCDVVGSHAESQAMKASRREAASQPRSSSGARLRRRAISQFRPVRVQN